MKQTNQVGYHLSPSKYDRRWQCSECSKPIDAIPGRFKIYNSRQLTCNKECALLRKSRLQAERRADRKVKVFGGRRAIHMPRPDAALSARRREVYRRSGA